MSPAMCLFYLKVSDPLSNNDIFIAIALPPSTLLNTCEQEQSDGHCESDRPSVVFDSGDAGVTIREEDKHI